MHFSDLFLFSVDNLRRRKGRTMLTIVGVLVGVCAIVVMVSLGVAVNNSTDEMLKNWGDLTRIEVSNDGTQQNTPKLDDSMVERFRGISGVLAATPAFEPQDVSGKIAAGPNSRYESSGQLIGLEPAAIEPLGYTLLAGSSNLAVSSDPNRIPVLVGVQAPFGFRDTQKSQGSPDAQKYPEYDEDYANITNLPRYDEQGALLNPEEFFFDIMHTKLSYRMAVGREGSGEDVYREYELVPVGMISGGASDWTINSGLIMSIESLKKLQADARETAGSSRGSGWERGSSTGGTGSGSADLVGVSGGDSSSDGVSNSGVGASSTSGKAGGYSRVLVKVDRVEAMDDVERSIKAKGYQIFSITETRRQMQGQVAQTQMMLGGLAAVSLFVAALNIMNTMTMAITERRREIGIMKVLGCELKNIRRMFLIEAGAIGLIGGVAGVLVSVLLSLLLNNLPALLTLLGLGAGGIDVGSFFGLGGLGQTGSTAAISVIPAWLIGFALLFAAAVGLFSGVIPARKAVRISSLEAIRHE
ncbi:MAG: ABC transporter permease [Coriobacteriales bacterium]|jgi:ABC-type antimicrobial peptide transport system permease subunit|nr:ABC transporter permease [Coriobacteriales bacterium]